MKNTTPPGTTYDGLNTCVERFMVQVAVSSHVHVIHPGISGRRRVQYHDRKQIPAKDKRPAKT